MQIRTYGAVFALLVVGLLGVSAAYSGATLVYTDSESVTVDYTQPIETTQSHPVASYLDNETVTNSTGATLAEGTDYAWNTTTGTLTFYNTSNTSAGNTATIDYAYRGHSERSVAMKAVLGLVFRILAALSLLGAGLVVIRWTGWIPGGGR